MRSGPATLTLQLRRERQRAIDASIARNAETEILYDQPYDRLKRALRAEIDEAAWAQLYSTISRPFPRPSTGKIAVKVINHYGDEVLQVYPV
jgi:hypothetical protein